MRFSKLNIFIVVLLLCFYLTIKNWKNIRVYSSGVGRDDALDNVVVENFTPNYCPLYPNRLVGAIKVLLDNKTEYEIEDILDGHGIEFGGKWSPKYCTPKTHLAVLIPYRNRYEHLLTFLHNTYPILIRQEISFGIYLIEPVQAITFNRGLLFNIGFVESNKETNDLWQCHAYHDVDLISENDKLAYKCYENPFHLTYRISKYGYRPTYKEYFGGAAILRKEDYELINGFSNAYFAWGAEDDDFRTRVLQKNLRIEQPTQPEYRFYMHKHKQEARNPHRKKILKLAARRQDYEGLSSLDYRIVSIQKTRLYTKFLVYYNQESIMSELNVSVAALDDVTTNVISNSTSG